MIVTFYSFKGGVGRSMGLVNVAEMLADAGYKVIVCDWDLEAPGLERYFFDEPEQAVAHRKHPGVIDLLLEYKETLAQPKAAASATKDGNFVEVVAGGPRLRSPASYAQIMSRTQRQSGGWIKLLTAGRRDREWNVHYTDAVRDFDWSEFYTTWAGGAYFDFFRKDLESAAQIILIDSRTGVTEAGGVCTHQLPDLVLLFSAANDQNIEGTRWMADILRKSTLKSHRAGRELGIFPIASRIERNADVDFLTPFRKRFVSEFSHYLPEELDNLGTFIEQAEIPYIAKYSFKESIVARQPREDRLRELAVPYEVITEGIVKWGLSQKLLGDSAGSETHLRSVAETTRVTALVPKGQFLVVSVGENDGRAQTLSNELRSTGMDIWSAALTPSAGEDAVSPYMAAVERSVGCVLIVSRSADEARLMAEINFILSRQAQRDGYRALLLLASEGENLETRTPLLRRLARMELPAQITPGYVAKIMAMLLPEPALIPEPDQERVREKLKSNAETNSRFFLGRDEELRTVLAALSDAVGTDRITILSGAAGEGKSSLIQAGLIPAIRRGLLRTNTRPWLIANVALSQDPLAELAGRLRQLKGGPAPAPPGVSFPTQVPEKSTVNIDDLLKEIAEVERPLVIIFDGVDTLALRYGWDSPPIAGFLSLLAAFHAHPLPDFLVVVSIRSSFLDTLISKGRDILSSRDVYVLPRMSQKGMAIFLVGAARLLGVNFETGLVERILGETARAGVTSRSLRVLLWRLSEQRRGDVLTHEAYAAIGGVEGVTIEDVGRTLAQVSGAPLAPTKVIITSLIQVRTGARLALPRETLLDLTGRDEGAEEAMVQLFDWNVLIFTENGNVTLANEAIPKLDIVQQWLRDDFDRLKAQAELEELAQKWHDTGRPGNLLPSGDALLRYRNVRAGGSLPALLLQAASQAERKKRVLATLMLFVLLGLMAGGVYGLLQLAGARSATKQLDQARQDLVDARKQNEDLVRKSALLEAQLTTTRQMMQNYQQQQTVGGGQVASSGVTPPPVSSATVSPDQYQTPGQPAPTTTAPYTPAQTNPPPAYLTPTPSPAEGPGGIDIESKGAIPERAQAVLAQALRKEGLDPRTWGVNGSGPSNRVVVKYYFPEDAEKAARVRRALTNVLIKMEIEIPKQLNPTQNYRPGHIDIWLPQTAVDLLLGRSPTPTKRPTKKPYKGQLTPKLF